LQQNGEERLGDHSKRFLFFFFSFFFGGGGVWGAKYEVAELIKMIAKAANENLRVFLIIKGEQCMKKLLLHGLLLIESPGGKVFEELFSFLSKNKRQTTWVQIQKR